MALEAQGYQILDAIVGGVVVYVMNGKRRADLVAAVFEGSPGCLAVVHRAANGALVTVSFQDDRPHLAKPIRVTRAALVMAVALASHTH